MSHQIEKNDVIKATEPTWHRLEKIEKVITFDNSGLDWLVTSVPALQLINGEHKEVEGFQVIRRQDMPDCVINIAKDSYAIIQNERVWQALEASLQGIGYDILCTGSLGNCSKIFISLKLHDQQDYLVNGDSFKDYLTFTSSHDGSMAFEAFDTSLRVVCNNTLQYARKSKGGMKMRVLHTKNHELKIQGMEQAIESLFEKRAEYYANLERLANQTLSPEVAKRVIAGFLGDGEKELSTRKKNQIDSIETLFESGQGNKGETVYDLLNGVTEYFTHHARKDGDSAKTFSQSEFGNGANKKAEFYDLLTNGQLEDLAAKGEKLLALAV